MALPNIVPLRAQYRTTQRRTPLVPYSAHDPPVSLPYASDSARSPEGKSGTSQGLVRGAMHRDHNVPHVQRAFLCCRACQKPVFACIWTRFISLCGLASEGLLAASNECEAQLQLALSLFVTHRSTAAPSGDTKQRCVVSCCQLPN